MRRRDDRLPGPADTSEDTFLLNLLDRALAGIEAPAVAILSAGAPSNLDLVLRTRHPDASVITLDVDALGEGLHVALAAHGPFHLVIDDLCRRKGRAELFRTGFLQVRPGGTWVVREFRAGGHRVARWRDRIPVQRLVRRLAKHRDRVAAGDATAGTSPALTRRDRSQPLPSQPSALAWALGSVVVEPPHLLVTSAAAASAKIREEEVEALLDRRPALGRILLKLPAIEFESRCTLRHNLPLRTGMPERYPVPALSVREYHHVVCAQEQVVFGDNVILPDSYRHPHTKRLRNDAIADVAPRFAVPLVDEREVLPLTGRYYYLDNGHRGHFGHLLTESVAKLWAWPEAKSADPELKALVALNRRRPVADFERDLLSAAGITTEDLVVIDAPVRVESLVAPSPMFSHPAYVHPDIAVTWHRLGVALEAAAPRRDYPRRLFCARRMRKRLCRNVDEVEAYFEMHGFEVVRPEEWSMAEQAAMFRHADVIAGQAGSAMFSILFCDTPKHVILFGPDTYRCYNEYMIAAVRGHRLDLVTSRAELDQPLRGYTKAAAASAFRFDFEREGRLLEQWLDNP